MTELVAKTQLTGDQIGEYLTALRENYGMEATAAKIANVRLTDIRRLRKQSPEFVEQESEIREQCFDVIEREMYRRAIEGVQKDRYHKGEYSHTDIEYSDQLLLALAKGNMPDKYGDKKQITANASGAIEVVIRDFSDISSTPPPTIIDVDPNDTSIVTATHQDARGQIPHVRYTDQTTDTTHTPTGIVVEVPVPPTPNQATATIPPLPVDQTSDSVDADKLAQLEEMFL